MPYFGPYYGEEELREYRIPRGLLYTQVMNDCLHNHPEARVRDIMGWYRVELTVALERFYLCLTGIKKDIYYSALGMEPEDYGDIFDTIRRGAEALLAEEGCPADVFMVLEEDAKQMAVLFSPQPGGAPPAAVAGRIGQMVQAVYEERVFKGDRRYCNVTALSGELSGFSGIREGYLQARALNDLSFFRMEPGVLTREDVENSRNAADYPTVMEACFQLALAVDEGDEEQAQSRLNELFSTLLRNSYNRALCGDALSYFKNLLQVRGTVYGILEGVDLDSLCRVESYLKIEECAQALSPVLSALCAAVRERGSCSRTVIQAMYYVKNHYAGDISLPDVARYANVNPNYISGIFRENTGMALRDYITAIRVEAAGKLLTEEGLKVAEAARAVGFYDTRYFTRVFKKLMGKSPAEYRSEQKNI